MHAWVLCAIVAASMLATSASSQVPTYVAEYLGPVIGASAMNESGQVVGSGTLAGGTRGWIAGPGSPVTALPLPPGHVSSFANDINEAGVIAGVVSPTTYPEIGGEAASWTPLGNGNYMVTLLGKLPGHVRSMALGLNDVGDVIGYSSNGTFRLPVLFTASGPVSLLSTGIFDPVSINDGRVLVDSSFTVKRMDLDTMIVEDLGAPPGSYLATRSAAINQAGQVCGSAILTTSTSCDRVAARYTDGVGWEVFSGCGTANGASDLNAIGDLVMRLNVAPYVFFEGLGTYRVEDLINDSNGHWYVINGYGLTLDGSRRMVVPATNSSTGQSGLVLLTPAEPTCQPNLGFGGPGALNLSLCGQALANGNIAVLSVTGAPPWSSIYFAAGPFQAPTPFAGGILVPGPIEVLLTLPANAGGALLLIVPGGNGPGGVFLQAGAYDPGLPGGISISNALHVQFLP